MTLAFTEAPHTFSDNLHPREMPEITWTHGDDLCNCTFQRIGDWANPYIARTRRVRVCCLENRMLEGNEDLVQDIPGYFNENTGDFETEPWVWDGEDDMPEHLFMRQTAIIQGLSLDETRVKFEGVEPPKGIARPKVIEKREGMSEYEVIGKQLMRIQELEKERNTLISVIHSIKNGDLLVDRIELQGSGFVINDENDVLPE
jgi:hypothetical protein